jgi:SpoIIAA-like
MGAEITDVQGGVVTVNLGGMLTQSELAQLQKAAADIIRVQGKVRPLVLAGHFTGWERGDWNEFSFQSEFDPAIEKMAIVGDKRWEDLALLFKARDLRRFPIE